MAWKLFCLEKENNFQAGELPGITAHCEVNMDESYAGQDADRYRTETEGIGGGEDPELEGTTLAPNKARGGQTERQPQEPGTILEEDLDYLWGV